MLLRSQEDCRETGSAEIARHPTVGRPWVQVLLTNTVESTTLSVPVRAAAFTAAGTASGDSARGVARWAATTCRIADVENAAHSQASISPVVVALRAENVGKPVRNLCESVRATVSFDRSRNGGNRAKYLPLG